MQLLLMDEIQHGFCGMNQVGNLYWNNTIRFQQEYHQQQYDKLYHRNHHQHQQQQQYCQEHDQNQQKKMECFCQTTRKNRCKSSSSSASSSSSNNHNMQSINAITSTDENESE